MTSSTKGKPQIVRVLRILEYVGTQNFVDRSLRQRVVKESHCTPMGEIREAFVNGIMGFEPVAAPEPKTVDIVFDGPPSHHAPRFVEIERDGKSIKYGEWIHRDDGYWVIRIPDGSPWETR